MLAASAELCVPSKKNLQGLHAKPRGQNERRWQPHCREERGDPQQLKKNCLISGKSLELSKYTSCIFVISVQSPAVIYSCRRPAKCVLLLSVLLLCAPQPCLTLGLVFRGRSSPAQQILIVHEGVWHRRPCDLLRYRRATPSENKLDTSRAGPAVFPPPVCPTGLRGEMGISTAVGSTCAVPSAAARSTMLEEAGTSRPRARRPLARGSWMSIIVPTRELWRCLG